MSVVRLIQGVGPLTQFPWQSLRLRIYAQPDSRQTLVADLRRHPPRLLQSALASKPSRCSNKSASWVDLYLLLLGKSQLAHPSRAPCIPWSVVADTIAPVMHSRALIGISLDLVSFLGPTSTQRARQVMQRSGLPIPPELQAGICMLLRMRWRLLI